MIFTKVCELRNTCLILNLISPRDPLATQLDRFTGRLELAKIIGALKNVRRDIGVPIFNDCVDRLRDQVSYLSSGQCDKSKQTVWPYMPTEAELILFKEVLDYFHINSPAYPVPSY